MSGCERKESFYSVKSSPWSGQPAFLINRELSEFLDHLATAKDSLPFYGRSRTSRYRHLGAGSGAGASTRPCKRWDRAFFCLRTNGIIPYWRLLVGC